MRIWQIFDYFDEGGVCSTRDWYAAQLPPVQAAFNAAVGELATLEDWEDEVPSFEILDRNPGHAGLSWIRFEATIESQKRQYRAVGRYRRDAREFILLRGLQKSGRTTVPPNAMDDAVRLLRQLEQRRGEIHGHFEEEEGMAEDGSGQEVP
jgi:hypothetical protein